jgi:hypothetical protein
VPAERRPQSRLRVRVAGGAVSVVAQVGRALHSARRGTSRGDGAVLCDRCPTHVGGVSNPSAAPHEFLRGLPSLAPVLLWDEGRGEGVMQETLDIGPLRLASQWSNPV